MQAIGTRVKLILKRNLLCLSLVLIFFSCLPPQNRGVRHPLKGDIDANRIRVLVIKTKSPVSIGSNQKFVIREKESSKLIHEFNGRTISFSPDKVTGPLVVNSWDSPISVNGMEFNGDMELYNVLGSIYVINVVLMRDYLMSVVPGEIPARWDIEALKAQAVASRTYAYYHIIKNKSSKLYDLDSTTSFQVYKGVSSLNPVTNGAVAQTSGEIVSHKGIPILAYFHSTCGGKTADDSDIWTGIDEPYLRSVSCSFCKESPHYEWEARLSLSGIRESLEKNNHHLGNVKSISFRIKSGRVAEVMVRHTQGLCNLTGNQFRLLFSTDQVKSTFFHSKSSGKELLLSGRGWGHGVGLCQWGAKGMAENGKAYKYILQYYYRGGRIEKVRFNSMLN